ncbi:Sulfite exporter TauE/SafE [Nocardioides dokdonensis FR1436]|uniref:Probable membrane transporter protein n=1 Tax=Nocardioides dokdonensis FR1436 TaxID=1300347 RepID=A0A1A9GNV3_9ACTN|nr:sulfite exporter TauE/SafE family protein [Nocardioides dokdonensis]ANH39974.1 Sulfite exporter TauE/SafE [Nocardioides dokdonensis FR1436]
MALALLAGATVQSLVGLGLGLVSAPVITLVEPRLMPELMLWLALALPFVTLAHEREDIDWHGLGWSLPSRVLGTGVGVVAVTALEPRLLGVAVGVMVLLAVAMTWRTVVLPLNRTSLVVAGAISGVSGTATSIGGPPLALLYQHRPPRTIRTTLAVYFMVGAALSLAGLGLAGHLERDTFLLALALSPVLAVGALLGRVLRPRLPASRVRPVVLLVCASSALVLLVRSLT